MTTQNNQSMLIGGKVIDAGGFGCVLYPSIPCNNSNKVNKKYVTKLMLKEYAEEEYDKINKIHRILENIHNYQKYFLINNIYLCTPSHLSKDDLVLFDKKCKPLVKNKINRNNINQHLDKLYALNMPYGGTSLDSILEHGALFSDIYLLNIHLIQLYQYGIIPMNNKHVCHGDLKASNILILSESQKDPIVRMIDWGMAFTKSNTSHYNKYTSSFNFNIIFSVLLMRDDFVKKYNSLLDSNNTTAIQIYEIIFDRINKEESGLKLLNMIFKILFKDTSYYEKVLSTIPDKMKKHKYQYIVPFLLHYNYKILKQFTYNQRFDANKYFTEVMIYNLDVWGFISCYSYLVLSYYNKVPVESYDLKIINAVRQLYMDILYYPTTKINHNVIINHLTDITNIYKEYSYNKNDVLYDHANKSSLPLSKTIVNTLNTTYTHKKHTSNSTIKQRHNRHRHRHTITLKKKN